MNQVWQGTHVFTWKIEKICGGNMNAMIQQAKQLGITGVIIKFSNGDQSDADSRFYMQQFKQYTPIFKQAGIRVGGWIYQYLTDVQGEIDACSQAIQSGAEWIVLDGEVELKNRNQQVAQFGQLFRLKYPNYPLVLSSFAIPDYHPEVPWNEYNQFVNAMMPQIYWAEMGWSVDKAFQMSIQSFSKFGKPILPTGQSCETAKSQDMQRFVQLCKQFGTHLSWWDLDECQDNMDQLNGIKNNILPVIQPLIQQPIEQWEIDVVNKSLAKGLLKDSHNPHEQTTVPFALATLMNGMKLPFVNVSQDWRVNAIQSGLKNGVIQSPHNVDELASKAFVLATILNALHVPIPQVSPDWKANTMSAAHNANIIEKSHNPDEIALVSFTLATIMNALRIA